MDANLDFLQPEIIVILTAFVVLGLEMFLPKDKRSILTHVALLGLTVALGAVIYLLGVSDGSTVYLSEKESNSQFIFDPVAGWFKISFLVSAILTVMLTGDLINGRFVPVVGQERKLDHRGEFYTIMLFNLAGMMFLISATNLVSLYVSLELATIPLFALVAWRRGDPMSSEAGMKYIILGATSSGILLFGLGVLYGVTGSVFFDEMRQLLQPQIAVWLAIAMVVVGVGFKLTLVPFHMWAADVYRGAPIPVTAYLSVASKAAGLAFMFQLFFRVLGGVLPDIGMAIAIVATVTMTLGNVVAIVQTNIKRFMAFSAVSQAGYLIMGFLGPDADGVSAMLFYVLVYAVSNMAVFGVIIFYLNETGREEIDDYRGLSRTNPIIALVMMLALFSLAGIPPLSGFVGKFFLFSVAAKAGFHWLVGVAAVNSTISLYYYLRIVRQMYIEPTFDDAQKIPSSPLIFSALSLSTLATIVLGIVPYFYETISRQTAGWLDQLL